MHFYRSHDDVIHELWKTVCRMSTSLGCKTWDRILKMRWKKHTTMGISAKGGLDHIAVAGVAPGSQREPHVDEAAGRQAAL